ncbi:rifin [Plasmodium reichenowi]|uniref:Rifin n=1 Tax=Plasmodium reichenowi TaxID=5854 RepID=A0A060RME2_PLARE|nr:rifin [Plasmodium reichenowi]
MKLHYSKILFFLPLNIWVTLYHVYNKNKPSITPHHTTIYTSRVLSEGDTQSSRYDNDEEIKLVKEHFHRQTSQRLREYDERLQEKRQKRKEQRDKNIQEIIDKDKMDKSLEEKIEKGCLKCGCALGGVAASVGLFGGLGIYGWKSSATATAMAEGVAQGLVAGETARIAEGIKAVIKGLYTELGVSILDGMELSSYFATIDYTNFKTIARAINKQYDPSSCLISGPSSGPVARETFCIWVNEKSAAARKIQGNVASTYKSIEEAVESIVSEAETVAGAAAEKATEDAIKISTAAVDAKYIICQNAVIASVVALLIIVFVMIIIYLILRYRRRKRMNKKTQYTKLLNQ